ncbi:MAG TPA: HD-GYP domain-containing protein, partial [bacterium]|nr:HD-GYP domain-containing protein [bacterium]
DGTGYPQGKKGDEIHEYAKIISIADTFDAMTKKRSFRQEKIPHNIMKEMLKLVEKKFDPKIMRVFLSTMAIYPIGSMVQLNTKELGLVIDINEASPLKPKVKILYDSQLKKVNNEDIKIIDLIKNEEYKIIGVINPKALGISIVDEI